MSCTKWLEIVRRWQIVGSIVQTKDFLRKKVKGHFIYVYTCSKVKTEKKRYEKKTQGWIERGTEITRTVGTLRSLVGQKMGLSHAKALKLFLFVNGLCITSSPKFLDWAFCIENKVQNVQRCELQWRCTPTWFSPWKVW